MELVFRWLRVLFLGDEVALEVGLRWQGAVCAVGRLAGGAVAGEHAGTGVEDHAVAAAEERDFGEWVGDVRSVGGGCCKSLLA